MNGTVITAEGLGKTYRIGVRPTGYRTLREAVTSSLVAPVRRLRRRGGSPGNGEDFWALRDVSFEVHQGEALGIIGANGAGKSTLLKILSRVTEPTEGRARLLGRVGALLAVGTGFHPELTGRENIYLNGSILGMGRREITGKLEDMVSFSGVEQFLDTPVKRYSSGMYVRLAFSVAAHLEPDILIVDEVLAVGDAAFQRKCLGKMRHVASSGRTVLFVSHNMGAIRRLTTRCMWIEHGRVREVGPPQEVTEAYLRSIEERVGGSTVFEPDPSKAVQVVEARLTGARGEARQAFQCDEPVVLEMVCDVRERTPGLYGFLQVQGLDREPIMVSDSRDPGGNLLDGLEAGSYRVCVTIPARTLAPGEYQVYASLASEAGRDGHVVDVPGIVASFTMSDDTTMRGNLRAGYFSTILGWDISS